MIPVQNVRIYPYSLAVAFLNAATLQARLNKEREQEFINRIAESCTLKINHPGQFFIGDDEIIQPQITLAEAQGWKFGFC